MLNEIFSIYTGVINGNSQDIKDAIELTLAIIVCIGLIFAIRWTFTILILALG